MTMRRFVSQHRVVLTMVFLAINLAYFVLALRSPEFATPLGVGWIAVLLTAWGVLQLGEDRDRG